MSSKKQDLKAGHPPAVKAGSMRITQRHVPSHETASIVPDDENNAALKVSTSPPKTTTISGAPVRGYADYPPEALHCILEKPVPTVECRSNQSRANVIHQPRK